LLVVAAKQVYWLPLQAAHKQEFIGMTSFALLLFGLTLTVGMIGCAKEEPKPAAPAAAPAAGETAPADPAAPAEKPAE
jgi:hypothetical protein